MRIKMKKVIYLIIGCLGFVSCGDFLKEYSQDLVYASSLEDMDEVLIGNGYMKHEGYPSLFFLRDRLMQYTICGSRDG